MAVPDAPITFVKLAFMAEFKGPGERLPVPDVAPGAAEWCDDDGFTGLKFICPCGCGFFNHIPIGDGGWAWNGNREKPSLTPSIQQIDGCARPAGQKWHGYLTDGIWKGV